MKDSLKLLFFWASIGAIIVISVWKGLGWGLLTFAITSSLGGIVNGAVDEVMKEWGKILMWGLLLLLFVIFFWYPACDILNVC